MAAPAPSKTSLRNRRREAALGYAFLAPAFAILALFHIYPLLAVVYGSLFRNWGSPKAAFCGLENFDRALSGSQFWHSLLITVYYVLGTAPVAMALGFAIAALLHQKIRAKTFYRAAYFLPYVTSTVAAAAVFRWIFGLNPRSPANIALGWLGLEPAYWTHEPRGILELAAGALGFSGYPAWAGGPSLALVCVMFFSVWHMLGFSIVVFLAGMSAIPNEVYEAAEVDGANWRQRTLHVTLPLLSPTVFFLSVISIIRAFQSFNDIFILTPIERANSTRNVIMLIVSYMREGGDLGFASAVSCILFLIVLSLTLVQMRVFERKVHYQ